MFPVRALLLPVHVVVALASTAIVPPEKFGCVLRRSKPKAYDGLCRSMKTKEDCYNVKMTCVWVPPPPSIYVTWSYHYCAQGPWASGQLAKPLAPGSSEQASGWECPGTSSTGTFTCALSDTTQLTAHWTLDGSADGGDGPAVSSGCSRYGGGGYFFECCFSTTPPPPPPPTPPPTPPIQTLIKGLYDPENMLLDLVGGKMYFQVDYGDIDDLHVKTQRANLNGSQLEDYKGDIPGPPFAMDSERAVDMATGKLYETYTDQISRTAHSIKRSNLDFSDKEIIVTNLPSPKGIALDVTRGKVYWIDEGYPAYYPNSDGGSINRANLDGSNSEIIMKGNASWTVPADCTSIALDVESGKMYLNHRNFISRANLDGSAFENVVATGAWNGGKIALDKKGGWLYWAQPTQMPSLYKKGVGTIKRVAFNFRSSTSSNAMLV